MDYDILRCILVMAILGRIIAPSSALEITNSPKIYSIANNTTITHVLFCS